MISRMELFSAGTCHVPAQVVQAGAPRGTIDLPVTVALLHHERLGPILFDTGYGMAVHALRKTLLGKLYAVSTPFTITPDTTVAAQLMRRGIAPTAIRHVILSHFHPDHVGGVKDFPNAQFITWEKGWTDVRSKHGLRALRKGFLPTLLPDGFAERLTTFRFTPEEAGYEVDENFSARVDLFGDGSAVAIPLEGHACGQFGVFISVGERKVLLAADASWVSANHEQLLPPSKLVRLFFDDWGAFRQNLQRLHDFHLRQPEVTIVPSHCPDALLNFQTLTA